ncbi:MAG: hypothetical protein GWN01_05500 [Nitrosopumilaceae archaeon]|nr:hypothetical protein [Nitrosopumilaceae archaeon]NIU86801.1 hypothetical protein [Nitrosopumilaceae archaeon]NIX61000.1 hypothetical protein [Nitrosopumilaceae archaeon]
MEARIADNTKDMFTEMEHELDEVFKKHKDKIMDNLHSEIDDQDNEDIACMLCHEFFKYHSRERLKECLEQAQKSAEKYYRYMELYKNQRNRALKLLGVILK